MRDEYFLHFHRDQVIQEDFMLQEAQCFCYECLPMVMNRFLGVVHYRLVARVVWLGEEAVTFV